MQVDEDVVDVYITSQKLKTFGMFYDAQLLLLNATYNGKYAPDILFGTVFFFKHKVLLKKER